MGKDGIAAKHSPQEADEWQAEVGTLVAEFATKQVCTHTGCCRDAFLSQQPDITQHLFSSQWTVGMQT